jgi:hypothetical protein
VREREGEREGGREGGRERERASERARERERSKSKGRDGCTQIYIKQMLNVLFMYKNCIQI